jgi:hypothetical protein
MSFSWRYAWRKWRATLLVEPLFLNPAGNLSGANLPLWSQPGVLVQDQGGAVEPFPPSADSGPASDSDPPLPR